jgi:hypothetical protein
MHAPFLGLKVNSFPSRLQQKFAGKGQALTPIGYSRARVQMTDLTPIAGKQRFGDLRKLHVGKDL